MVLRGETLAFCRERDREAFERVSRLPRRSRRRKQHLGSLFWPWSRPRNEFHDHPRRVKGSLSRVKGSLSVVYRPSRKPKNPEGIGIPRSASLSHGGQSSSRNLYRY